VGFPKRDPGKLQVALAHTHCTMWIRCSRGSRWARLGQMLGFARATSDKALTATIWDVAVRRPRRPWPGPPPLPPPRLTCDTPAKLRAGCVLGRGHARRRVDRGVLWRGR